MTKTFLAQSGSLIPVSVRTTVGVVCAQKDNCWCCFLSAEGHLLGVVSCERKDNCWAFHGHGMAMAMAMAMGSFSCGPSAYDIFLF